jgi:D-sedoheptulose 7-phosphate isomerase
MLEARIQQHFFESADLLYQLADGLSRPISEAAQAAVGCLTAGGKLLTCAQSGDIDLARRLCSALMLRFERERPALCALTLSPTALQPLQLDTAAASVAASASLALQVRSLGNPGDLLVVFAGLAEDDAGLRAAIDEAHAKDISVVLLTGGEPGIWQRLLIETDVWIAVGSTRAARVREIHLLALHALCDAIDIQLLGEADPA